jgi:hypothetical protein
MLVLPNPTVADALSGLEEAEPDDPAFEALCRRLRAKASDGPFVQWALEPVTPSPEPDALPAQELLGGELGAEWTWYDRFHDCAFSVGNEIEMRAANGRDLLSVNLSAPRLLRPVSGDWIVQTKCAPLSADRPAIGGLVLWKDKENYLRLDRGATGTRDLYFGGSIEDQDVLIGRGRLPGRNADTGLDSVFLRLERVGDRVKALGSTDGERWFGVGAVPFAVEDPLQVGAHAIGKIDRAVYRGAYPEGTAIRFDSFSVWQL